MVIRWMAVAAGSCLMAGLPLAATAGPTPGGADPDGDGVENAFDNCSSLSNASQKDLDHDGCGDLCDCDFNQDGGCGIDDFAIFKSAYGKGLGSPGYDARTDMDCDGGVGVSDFGLFRLGFGRPAGPSGLPSSLKTPVVCP